MLIMRQAPVGPCSALPMYLNSSQEYQEEGQKA